MADNPLVPAWVSLDRTDGDRSVLTGTRRRFCPSPVPKTSLISSSSSDMSIAPQYDSAMTDNPYNAPIVAELSEPQKPAKPPKTFSWSIFLIIVVGGHFWWLTDWLSEIVPYPAYSASSFTARLVIVMVVAFLVARFATRF